MAESILCHHCHGKSQLGVKLGSECRGHNQELKSESHRGYHREAMFTQDEDWVDMCGTSAMDVSLHDMSVCIQVHMCVTVCSSVWRPADNLRRYYSEHILPWISSFVCLVCSL